MNMLTDEERNEFADAVAEQTLWHDGWQISDSAVEWLESWATAREAKAAAKALRDAADRAMPISGYMGTFRWISDMRLREIADELDPPDRSKA